MQSLRHIDRFNSRHQKVISCSRNKERRRIFIDQINRETDDYRYIYLMRPGVTSYATLFNGYTDTMDKMLKRLEYDLDYLDNRTIFTDLGIMIRTFFSVFSGKKF